MNPAARLSIALLVGLLLWLPTLSATMRGEVGLPASGVRYLVAFGLAQLALEGLSRLVQGYATAAEPADSSESLRRRADDMDAAAGAS